MCAKRGWENWWDREASKDFLRAKHSKNPMYGVITKEVSRLGGSTLDVGCATCIAYDTIHPLGVKYVGVDITQKFLEKAREIHPEIEVRHASALELPYEDRSFTSVFCMALLAHMHPDEYQLAITEMARVAEKQLIIGWFKTPGKRKITRRVETPSGTWRDAKKGEKGAFSNTYDKRQVQKTIRNLKHFKKLRIITVGKKPVYVIELGD